MSPLLERPHATQGPPRARWDLSCALSRSLPGRGSHRPDRGPRRSARLPTPGIAPLPPERGASFDAPGSRGPYSFAGTLPQSNSEESSARVEKQSKPSAWLERSTCASYGEDGTTARHETGQRGHTTLYPRRKIRRSTHFRALEQCNLVVEPFNAVGRRWTDHLAAVAVLPLLCRRSTEGLRGQTDRRMVMLTRPLLEAGLARRSE